MARVLLDCDGVLADFIGHLFAELRMRGQPVPERLNDYEVFSVLDEKVADLAKDILHDAFFWAEIPRHEEAVAAVEALKTHGHDIAIVTAPWVTCTGWEFARKSWLKRNFGLNPKRVIPTGLKDWIHGHVFVDDHPEHVRAWQKKWPYGKAFLMNRTWNETSEVPCPRINWDAQGVETLLAAAHALS